MRAWWVLGVIACGSSTTPVLRTEPPPGAVEVRPLDLQRHRIAGELTIVPDDETKVWIARTNQRNLRAVHRFCIDATGVPATIVQRTSSGLRAYDRTIVDALRAWRFSPWLVDGKATPACTDVTVIYHQR